MTQDNEAQRKRAALKSLFLTMDESNQLYALMLLKTLEFAQTSMQNPHATSTPTP